MLECESLKSVIQVVKILGIPRLAPGLRPCWKIYRIAFGWLRALQDQIIEDLLKAKSNPIVCDRKPRGKLKYVIDDSDIPARAKLARASECSKLEPNQLSYVPGDIGSGFKLVMVVFLAFA